MNALTNSSGTAGMLSIATIRHHAPVVATVARTLPLVRDVRIVPVPFRPADPLAIERALWLDRRLPSETTLDAARFQIEDAINAGPASMRDVATVLPLFLEARPAFKPDRAGALIAMTLELVRVEQTIEPVSLDIVVLALMSNLREAAFTPTPSEIIAAIGRARREVNHVGDELPRLLDARESADDLLIAAGLREPVADTESWEVGR